jgi:hypothetical protein
MSLPRHKEFANIRARKNWLIFKTYINLFLICRVFEYDLAEHIFRGYSSSRKDQIVEDKKLPLGFINPNLMIMKFKNWLVSLVSIYYIFTIPLKWAIDMQNESWMYVDLTIDILMMIDIWVDLRTAVYTVQTGEFNFDP